MKKFLSMLLVLVLALSMTAFAFAEEDGKITIWTWDQSFNIAAMKVAAEMYNVDHPDVEITIDEVAWDDIQARVIAANGDVTTMPDILLIQDNSMQKFITNYPDLFVDVTDLYDLSDFGAAKVAYSTMNGRNYGIPFDAGTVVSVWRTDYLEEAGYTVADLTDIDWDRFLEIARDVKEKTGRPMLSGVAGDVDMLMIMLQSCGASLFNEDGSVNMKDNEPLKEILEVYNTMVAEGLFIEVNSWDEYIGTLSNQSVVGTINGCWILGTIFSLEEQSGLWAMTNMPKLVKSEGATNYSNNGGSTWTVVNTKDVDLALDFLKAYTNVDFYSTILPTTSAIATYTPAKEGDAYTAPNEYFNGETIFATILEYGALVPSNITGAYYYDARTALGTAKTNIIMGGDIDSELATAEDTVNFAIGF